MHGRCSSAGRHMDNCQASAIHEAAADPIVDAQSLRPMTLNIIKSKATTNSALIPARFDSEGSYREFQRLSAEPAALGNRSIMESAGNIRG